LIDPGTDGWLKVIGAGTRIGQLTLEAQRALQEADVVFALVANVNAFEMLRFYNPTIVDVCDRYEFGKERSQTYREMADAVLEAVRAGHKVCFAIYGHPVVFALPGRLAIEDARRDGHFATFLPGISALDSMWCDLEFDPATHGCQVYSATSFVRENRPFDPDSVLTLWQVSIIGESRLMKEGVADAHRLLSDRLEAVYGPSHPMVLYIAASTPFELPAIEAISVSEFRSAKIAPLCTVVVPPRNFPRLFDPL
jgi:tetrapyrrole (corrin/porphyrin) methylase-like protein